MQRGHQEISLTAREFSVLEQLMRSAGDVVSKREIVEHVWDLHFDGDLNIVEVYVRSLRKKIDEPFDRDEHRDRSRRRIPVAIRRWLSVS